MAQKGGKRDDNDDRPSLSDVQWITSSLCLKLESQAVTRLPLLSLSLHQNNNFLISTAVCFKDCLLLHLSSASFSSSLNVS